MKETVSRCFFLNTVYIAKTRNLQIVYDGRTSCYFRKYIFGYTSPTFCPICATFVRRRKSDLNQWQSDVRNLELWKFWKFMMADGYCTNTIRTHVLQSIVTDGLIVSTGHIGWYTSLLSQTIYGQFMGCWLNSHSRHIIGGRPSRGRQRRHRDYLDFVGRRSNIVLHNRTRGR